jgi:hypothetical protein
MRAHDRTVAHVRPAKMMHKREARLRVQSWPGGLSAKERLVGFDQEEAAAVLEILLEDPDFQAKGRQITATPVSKRRELAEHQAKSYAPNRSAGQRRILELLLLIGEEPWAAKGCTRQVYFENLARTAIWTEAPLEEHDARRVRGRWPTLEAGAHALARFGANRCIHCGAKLGNDPYERGAFGSSRRTHCDACKQRLRRRPGAIESDVDAKRQALDVLTDRRLSHRAARRLT